MPLYFMPQILNETSYLIIKNCYNKIDKNKCCVNILILIFLPLLFTL